MSRDKQKGVSALGYTKPIVESVVKDLQLLLRPKVVRAYRTPHVNYRPVSLDLQSIMEPKILI